VKRSGKGAEIRDMVSGKEAASLAAIVAFTRAISGRDFQKESG
jgi:hypothetical protein